MKQTNFPANVLVLSVMGSKGDIMPPHFFLQGLRLNDADYKDVLDRFVRFWMESMKKE